MAIPKQAKRLAEEADRQIQQLTAETPEPAAEQPVDTPEEPAPLPVPEPEVVATPAPKSEPDASWEARFRTLQGKYNAEVPALASELEEMRRKLDELQSVRAQPAEPRETPPPPDRQADADLFGNELVDMVLRYAQHVADAQLQEVRARIDELEKHFGSFESRTKRVEQTSYVERLTKLVPDWEEINSDPAFLDWCTQIDPVTRVPNQTFLSQSFEAQDADWTARILLKWKEMFVVPAKPSAPEPRAPSERVQRQVAPGRSQAAVVQSEAATPMWTQAKIAQFYRDVTRGVYNAQPAEKARIEAEINLAVAQGRVI